jgi:tape measure domain-containing protein
MASNTTMTEVFRLIGTIMVNKGQVTGDLKEIDAVGKQTAVSLDNSAKKAGSGFNTHLDTALKGVEDRMGRVREMSDRLSTGLLAAGGAMLAVSAGTVKLAGDFEQTEMAFTSMLGSAKAAGAFLKDLQEFANKTPFEFKQLTDSSRKLMAFGFQAQKIVPMLTDIGDAVAAMGGGADMIDRVTLALGQMSAKGKTSAGEMLQLTEAGIPAWRYLSQEIGVSTKEVMKLSEKGLIPADKAIQAILAGMRGDFGGMMAKQAETLNGELSTLQDTITSTARVMGTALIPQAHALTQYLQKLTDQISAMSDEEKASLGKTILWTGALLAGTGVLLKLGTGIATIVIAIQTLRTAHVAAATAAAAHAAATTTVGNATVATSAKIGAFMLRFGPWIAVIGAATAAWVAYSRAQSKPIRDAEDHAKALKKEADALNTSIEADKQRANRLNELADAYEALRNKQNRTVSETAELNRVGGELNELMTGAGKLLDTMPDKWDKSASSVREYAKALSDTTEKERKYKVLMMEGELADISTELAKLEAGVVARGNKKIATTTALLGPLSMLIDRQPEQFTAEERRQYREAMARRATVAERLNFFKTYGKDIGGGGFGNGNKDDKKDPLPGNADPTKDIKTPEDQTRDYISRLEARYNALKAEGDTVGQRSALNNLLYTINSSIGKYGAESAIGYELRTKRVGLQKALDELRTAVPLLTSPKFGTLEENEAFSTMAIFSANKAASLGASISPPDATVSSAVAGVMGSLGSFGQPFTGKTTDELNAETAERILQAEKTIYGIVDEYVDDAWKSLFAAKATAFQWQPGFVDPSYVTPSPVSPGVASVMGSLGSFGQPFTGKTTEELNAETLQRIEAEEARWRDIAKAFGDAVWDYRTHKGKIDSFFVQVAKESASKGMASAWEWLLAPERNADGSVKSADSPLAQAGKFILGSDRYGNITDWLKNKGGGKKIAAGMNAFMTATDAYKQIQSGEQGNFGNAISGASAGFSAAQAAQVMGLGTNMAVLGPIGILAGGITGMLMGDRAEKKAERERAERQRQAMLDELRQVKNTLVAVHDIFRSARFDLVPTSGTFGSNQVAREYRDMSSRGVR